MAKQIFFKSLQHLHQENLQSTSHGESNIFVSDGSNLKFEWDCEGGPIEIDLALSHSPGCSIDRSLVTAVGLEPRSVVNYSNPIAK